MAATPKNKSSINSAALYEQLMDTVKQQMRTIDLQRQMITLMRQEYEEFTIVAGCRIELNPN